MSLYYGLNIEPSKDEEIHRLTCERDQALDMLQDTIEALKAIADGEGNPAEIARQSLTKIGYRNENA